MNSNEYLSLSDDDRLKIIAATDSINIKLGAHADEIIRGKLDDIRTGNAKLIDATTTVARQYPDIEIITLVVRK